MKDTERHVRKALRQTSLPEESEAESRAWRLVQAAYAERGARRSPHRLRNRGLQLALVLALAVALISPAGASVRHWVADTVDPGREPSRPALTSLPAPGSLLVQSAAGPWVVHADGSKRLLGSYAEATWSPNGLFVAATGGHQLATLTPGGEIHWTLERSGPVRLASWNAPDGFRIAYLDGASLRVVDGDGTNDRRLEPRVAPIAPAWMPGRRYVLAFARTDGAIEAVRSDSGKKVFETARGERPRSLQWSTNARKLLITRPAAVEIHDRNGPLLWRWPAPAGTRILAARLEPRSDRVAVIVNGGGRSRLLLVGPRVQAQSLFSGPGRFSGVEWSPDGRWLLLAWRSADQWLFLDPARPPKVIAVSNISSQFAPGALPQQAEFPAIRGWCCSR